MKFLTFALGLGLALPALAMGREACQETQVFDPLLQLKTLKVVPKAMPKALPKTEELKLPTITMIEAPEIELSTPNFEMAYTERFPKLRPPKKDRYQVILHVPQGAIQGLEEGIFPAVQVSAKTENGTWKKRKNTSVSVRKVGNVYDVYVTLKKKPAADTLLAVEFKNGFVFPIENKFLSMGAERSVSLPKEFAKESYNSLHSRFPKERSLLAKAISPATQLGPQVGFSLMMGNPLPLAYSVFGMTTRKIAVNRATNGKLEAQREQIQMLEQELVGLRGQLAQLQQTGNQQLAQRQ